MACRGNARKHFFMPLASSHPKMPLLATLMPLLAQSFTLPVAPLPMSPYTETLLCSCRRLFVPRSQSSYAKYVGLDKSTHTLKKLILPLCASSRKQGRILFSSFFPLVRFPPLPRYVRHLSMILTMTSINCWFTTPHTLAFILPTEGFSHLFNVA